MDPATPEKSMTGILGSVDLTGDSQSVHKEAWSYL